MEDAFMVFAGDALRREGPVIGLVPRPRRGRPKMAARPKPLRRTSSVEPLDQIRLVVKVAQMYHERKLNQPAIAAQLRISQARVSRTEATAPTNM
jgi:hypothetical protein